MSFNYDQREVFNHVHLAKDENAIPEEAPKWGYICDSCGRDSRTSYSGKEAILSYDLADIVEAWYQHLIKSHNLNFPGPVCPAKIWVPDIDAYLRCTAGEEGHGDKHKFEL